MLFFASGKIEVLVKGLMPGLYGKRLFLPLEKLRYPSGYQFLEEAKKIEMIFHLHYH